MSYHAPPDSANAVTIVRFYLDKRETLQAEWVRVERQAGFRPKGPDHGQPATGGFSGGGYSGSSSYVATVLVDNTEYECVNCREPVMLVQEWDYTTGRFYDIVRHWDQDYSLHAGPQECDITLVKPIATIAPGDR